MRSAYCSPAYFEALIGRDAAILAAPSADRQSVDLVLLQEVLDTTADEVDAALRGRFVLPIDPIPALLRRAVARIAHVELIDESVVAELIIKRGAEARAQIRKVASGELDLELDVGDGDGGATRTGAGKVVLTLPSGHVKTTRESLAGLV